MSGISSPAIRPAPLFHREQLSATERYLLNKYGTLVMTVDEIASELRYRDPKSILNAISAGRFPIKTRREGKYRVADVRDVAGYLDERRSAS